MASRFPPQNYARIHFNCVSIYGKLQCISYKRSKYQCIMQTHPKHQVTYSKIIFSQIFESAFSAYVHGLPLAGLQF